MLARIRTLFSRSGGRKGGKAKLAYASGAVSEGPCSFTSLSVCPSTRNALTHVIHAGAEYVVGIDEGGAMLLWEAGSGDLISSAARAHGFDSPTAIVYLPPSPEPSHPDETSDASSPRVEVEVPTPDREEGDVRCGMVVTGAGGTIRMFSVPSLALVYSQNAHAGAISLLADIQSPGNTQHVLVSAAHDEPWVFLWGNRLESVVRIQIADGANVNAHLFFPHSSALLLATELPGLIHIDTATHQVQETHTRTELMASLTKLSPSVFASIAGSGQKIYFWEISPDGDVLAVSPSGVSIPVDPFGKALASVASNSARLRLTSPIGIQSGSDPTSSGADAVAVAYGAGFLVVDAEPKEKDKESILVSVPCAHDAPVRVVAVVAGGAFLVTGAADGTIKVWGDVRTGPASDPPYAFDFSPGAVPEPVVLAEFAVLGGAATLALSTRCGNGIFVTSKAGDVVLLRDSAVEWKALSAAASYALFLRVHKRVPVPPLASTNPRAFFECTSELKHSDDALESPGPGSAHSTPRDQFFTPHLRDNDSLDHDPLFSQHQSHDRAPDRALDRAPDRAPDRALDRAPEQREGPLPLNLNLTFEDDSLEDGEVGSDGDGGPVDGGDAVEGDDSGGGGGGGDAVGGDDGGDDADVGAGDDAVAGDDAGAGDDADADISDAENSDAENPDPDAENPDPDTDTDNP